MWGKLKMKQGCIQNKGEGKIRGWSAVNEMQALNLEGDTV